MFCYGKLVRKTTKKANYLCDAFSVFRQNIYLFINQIYMINDFPFHGKVVLGSARQSVIQIQTKERNPNKNGNKTIIFFCNLQTIEEY